jgi:hypothetical protein
MIRIQGFLPEFAPIHLEGFGSALFGNQLFTLIHQGSLTASEYFPSLIIRTNIKDESWASVLVDTTVGFPKSTAVFDEITQTVFFVDHDKENDSTKLLDGNWRGGYLNSVDLRTGKLNELSVNTDRRFWHDLKEVGDDVIALAFSNDITLYNVNLRRSLFLPNIGSFSAIENELIVSPYGGGNKALSFVDLETLTVRRQFQLSSVSFIHETYSLNSVDGVKRAILFQEEFAESPHYILENYEVSAFDGLPNPRTIFGVDLNEDEITDLILGTNDGTRYFLNNGYGKFLEVSVPELEGHFNVHAAGSMLVSLDWPSAAPRLNIQKISSVSKFLTTKDATSLGLKPNSFIMLPSESGLVIIQDSVARQYDWNALDVGGMQRADGVEIVDGFKALPVHRLGASSPPKVFLPIFNQSLATLVLPEHVTRVQTLESFRAFDMDGNAGQAYRVYKAAFNRDPMQGDTGGLGYWIAQIDDGMDLIEVSARFVDSNEFRALYGTNPTNAQFLTKLYQNVLGRDPEALGYNWWLNELNTNPSKTKAKALADFSESGENQTGVASLIGNGITYEPWVG